jgi:hypothetical protein
MAGPRVFFEDDGVRMVLWESVAFWCWRGLFTSERLDAGRRFMKLALARPDPIGSFTLLPDFKLQGSLLLDDQLRKKHTALYSLVDGRRGGNVIAVEMNGFLATTMRALATGAMLVSRTRFPLKIYDRREPAATWLAERMAGGTPPITAQAILDVVRRYEAW